MAITYGARTGVALWSDPGDHPLRADFSATHQAIEDKMALDVQGTLAARPVAAIRGRYYWATDDRGGRLSRDDGVTWTDLGPKPIDGPLAGGYTARITGHASAGVADPVLVLQGKAGQTGDLARAVDPAGTTTLWRVDSTGRMIGSAGATLSPASIAAVGLVVDGLAGQTADLLSLRVNTAVKASVSPAGDLSNAGAISAGGNITAGAGGATPASVTLVGGSVSGRVIYQDTAAVYVGAVDVARPAVVRAHGTDTLTLQNGTGLTAAVINGPAGLAASLLQANVGGSPRFYVAADGAVVAVGDSHYFGRAANGATGGRLKLIGTGAGGAIVAQDQAGSLSGPLTIQGLTVALWTSAGEAFGVKNDPPLTAETSWRIRYNSPTTGVQSNTLSIGAVDSGGAGFRLLRVPN